MKKIDTTTTNKIEPRTSNIGPSIIQKSNYYDIICHTPDIIIVAGAKNEKTKSVLFRGESGRGRQHGQPGRAAANGGQLREPVRRVVFERSRDAQFCQEIDCEEGGSRVAKSGIIRNASVGV